MDVLTIILFFVPLPNTFLSFDVLIRPDAIDKALLRPRRFSKLLYVPLPSPDERGMILKALAGKRKIDATVDLMTIRKDSSFENFCGADLFELVHPYFSNKTFLSYIVMFLDFANNQVFCFFFSPNFLKKLFVLHFCLNFYKK